MKCMIGRSTITTKNTSHISNPSCWQVLSCLRNYNKFAVPEYFKDVRNCYTILGDRAIFRVDGEDARRVLQPLTTTQLKQESE